MESSIEQARNTYKRKFEQEDEGFVSGDQDNHQLNEDIDRFIFTALRSINNPSDLFKNQCIAESLVQSLLRCVNEGQDVTPLTKGFRCLERYFSLLVEQPWKPEYRLLKTYSGYYKTKIQSVVMGAEMIFRSAGYTLETGNTLTYQHENVDLDQLLSFAFECFVAAEICQRIINLRNEMKAVGRGLEDAIEDVLKTFWPKEQVNKKALFTDHSSAKLASLSNGRYHSSSGLYSNGMDTASFKAIPPPDIVSSINVVAPPDVIMSQANTVKAPPVGSTLPPQIPKRESFNNGVKVSSTSNGLERNNGVSMSNANMNGMRVPPYHPQDVVVSKSFDRLNGNSVSNGHIISNGHGALNGVSNGDVGRRMGRVEYPQEAPKMFDSNVLQAKNPHEIEMYMENLKCKEPAFLYMDAMEQDNNTTPDLQQPPVKPPRFTTQASHSDSWLPSNNRLRPDISNVNTALTYPPGRLLGSVPNYYTPSGLDYKENSDAPYGTALSHVPQFSDLGYGSDLQSDTIHHPPPIPENGKPTQHRIESTSLAPPIPRRDLKPKYMVSQRLTPAIASEDMVDGFLDNGTVTASSSGAPSSVSSLHPRAAPSLAISQMKSRSLKAPPSERMVSLAGTSSRSMDYAYSKGKCPHCGALNNVTNKNCIHCNAGFNGAPLKSCQVCTLDNKWFSQHCDACGKDLPDEPSFK